MALVFAAQRLRLIQAGTTPLDEPKAQAYFRKLKLQPLDDIKVITPQLITAFSFQGKISLEAIRSNPASGNVLVTKQFDVLDRSVGLCLAYMFSVKDVGVLVLLPKRSTGRLNTGNTPLCDPWHLENFVSEVVPGAKVTAKYAYGDKKASVETVYTIIEKRAVAKAFFKALSILPGAEIKDDLNKIYLDVVHPALGLLQVDFTKEGQQAMVVANNKQTPRKHK